MKTKCHFCQSNPCVFVEYDDDEQIDSIEIWLCWKCWHDYKYYENTVNVIARV